MHIVHVVPRGEQPSSGILTVIVHLAAALARRGHRIEVIQLHRWDPVAYADQRGVLETAGVEVVPVLAPWNVGRQAARTLDARGAEVVHLHGAFNPWNTLVSRALDRPYVFSPHSGYHPVSLCRSRLRKMLYRALFERRMVEGASLVTALTAAEREEVRAFVATASCEVIPNGVVVPSVGDLDALAFRREIGVEPDGLLAVFVGRLDVHRKGLDVLVRGMAGAPTWRLALVGPRFRGVDGLERLIAAVGVEDRVHLVGERHGRALLESVVASDLFALLSRWEGHPMALLEALSLNLPAVVSPAVARVIDVQSSGAGWVVEDATDLGRLLGELDRTEITRRRGPAATLARRYDWDDIAHRYELAYERALGRA